MQPPYYTAADLAAGALPARARLGVVGNPIAHSVSPPMQQAALDTAGLPHTYIRLLCEREEGAFPALISALRRAQFVGANVTVPFKKQAYALADEADPLSRLCGAANTLVFRGEKTACYNTDGPGFERAIHELCGCGLAAQRSIVLLGACGGAGAALAAQCVLSGCPCLTLVNRPRPELGAMLELLQPHCRPGATLRALSFADTAGLRAAVAGASLVVNATSLGLTAADPLPLPAEMLHAGAAVYDLITHPTPLLRAAAERGCLAAGGRSMLLWQGALAFEHWFGRLPEIEPMRQALATAAGA